MARRRKRRRGAWLACLWRHRFLLAVVFFLAGAGGLYWKAIKYVGDYSRRIAEAQQEVDKAEKGSDLARYIALQRNLELQRVEPVLWILLGAIIVTFATVLIVAIIKARNDDGHHESRAKAWEAMMEERRQIRASERRSPPNDG